MSISADQVLNIAAHPIAQLNDIDISGLATITVPFINGGDLANHIANFFIIENTAGTIGIGAARILLNGTNLSGILTLSDTQGGRIPYLPKQDTAQPTTGIIEIDITTASLDPAARINLIVTGFSIS